MAIKTLKQWNKTDLDLDKFLNPCDEVDQYLYDYMASIVHPQYISENMLQVGEADIKINSVYFFTTFIRANNKYYYLGSLPEFKK